MNTLPELSSSAVIGVDIGGTKIAAGIVTPTGEAMHVQTVRTPALQGAAVILNAVADLVRQLLERAHRQSIPISAVGVGAGGQIDVAAGCVRYATDVISGWSGADIVGVLQAQLALPVTVDNDGNVWALGEQRFGAGRPYRDLLCVAVGTGVGGGLIMNNQLVRGHSYSGGDLSHLLVEYRDGRICTCGQPGHLEAYAAGPAIARRYCELAKVTPPCELPTVAAKANEGDLLARTAIEEGAQILGKALNGVLGLLDPQALVIGGGVTQLGAMWWDPLLSEIRAHPFPSVAQIPVHRAALGQHAAVIGAAALAYG